MKQDIPEQIPSSIPFRKPRFLAWPVTRLGWWSFGLGAVTLLLPLLTLVGNLTSRIYSIPLQISLGVSGLFLVACGIAAGITGLIAVIRNRERSIFLWICMLIGLFFLFLIVGEFAVPH
jgi:hypothetical protein